MTLPICCGDPVELDTWGTDYDSFPRSTRENGDLVYPTKYTYKCAKCGKKYERLI